MTTTEPEAVLDPGFSSPGATPTPWATARQRLEEAELYWISTVRPDGRPHVTPLVGVWHDGAMWFTTGADERKGRNLAGRRPSVLTTGTNSWKEGLDVVVEGEAVRVRDDAVLAGVADAYLVKYHGDWRFEVRDGSFAHEAGLADVYRVEPAVVFAFAKGDYAQTRYRFSVG